MCLLLLLQGMEKTSYDAAAFVEAWKQVWSAVTCLPNFRRDMVGRVFVDILNEPDSQWQAWQPKDGKAGQWGRTSCSYGDRAGAQSRLRVLVACIQQVAVGTPGVCSAAAAAALWQAAYMKPCKFVYSSIY
jgi:hypothetical protein